MPQQQYVIPGYGSQPMSYSGLPQMYMQEYPNYFMPEVQMPSQLKKGYVRMNHYS